MTKSKVENIVASTKVAEELDLVKVSKELPNCEYEPEQFPGVVCRIREPKTAILLFMSGRAVCTGAKNLEDVNRAIQKICSMLTDIDIKVIDKPKVLVQNIVATSQVDAEPNLDAIAKRYSIIGGRDVVEYEPEQFPGLVYRVKDPKVVILLFSSGKLVCTGAKNIEDIDIGLEKMYRELKKEGLI